MEPQSLTKREKQVLPLYARGASYREIAEKLGISDRTVGTYMQVIRAKMRTNDRVKLVEAGLKMGKKP